jgi:hypothetical protein
LCCHNVGFDSLLYLLKLVDSKEEKEILKYHISSQDSILKLIYDTNGSQIAQLIIEILNENDRHIFNEIILTQFVNLIKDTNGIYLVRKFIYFNPSSAIKVKIAELIRNNIWEISRDYLGRTLPEFVINVKLKFILLYK